MDLPSNVAVIFDDLSEHCPFFRVHELIGLHNNRVDSSKLQHIPSDLREVAQTVSFFCFYVFPQVVLCPDTDEFYASTMYLNFGELAEKLSAVMDDFQQRARQVFFFEWLCDFFLRDEKIGSFVGVKWNFLADSNFRNEISSSFSLMPINL